MDRLNKIFNFVFSLLLASVGREREWKLWDRDWEWKLQEQDGSGIDHCGTGTGMGMTALATGSRTIYQSRANFYTTLKRVKSPTDELSNAGMHNGVRHCLCLL